MLTVLETEHLRLMEFNIKLNVEKVSHGHYMVEIKVLALKFLKHSL